jgi:RimJ/RimL family protein N-acetyltransferase
MPDMDSRAARLSLHAVDEPEARRIRGRAPRAGDPWAPDYPFEGDLAALGSFLRATDQNGEQGPYGYYQIRRRSDGLAIGGVGFKGPPDGGVVEVGYGLVPSARGQGYAAEALEILVQIAAGLGVATIRAETDPDNGASRRTLEHAGLHRVDADPGVCHYERRTSRHGVGAGLLGQGPGPRRPAPSRDVGDDSERLMR